MITDDAGELPGVSMALPVAGLSMVRMLEIESRSWILRLLSDMTSRTDALKASTKVMDTSLEDVQITKGHQSHH
jgi:hypothetical protein